MALKAFSIHDLWQHALPDWGVIAVSGVDAGNFLQGQLSCDVRKVSQNQAVLGCYANLQGRVVALFVLCLVGDDYYLILPKDTIPTTVEQLKKYAIFSKVNITIPEPAFTISAITGKPSGLGWPKAPLAQTVMQDATVIRYAENLQAYLILTPHTACESLHIEAAQGDGHTWRLAHILSDIPILTEATQAQFVPQNLGLVSLGVIDFHKGCYLGQEIIARLHHRGQSKYQMTHVAVESPVALETGMALSIENNKHVTVMLAEPIGDNHYQLQVVLPTQHAHVKTWQLDGTAITLL